jgi:NAD-dependent dihydropyrimidine dehydrogenase PreA subunit
MEMQSVVLQAYNIKSIARYELLDATKGTFQAGEIALTNILSPYDWLVTTNGLTNISVPQSLCFQLPPPVQALRLEDSPVANNKERKAAKLIHPSQCLGCGVCVYKCPTQSLSLEPRAKGFRTHPKMPGNGLRNWS